MVSRDGIVERNARSSRRGKRSPHKLSILLHCVGAVLVIVVALMIFLNLSPLKSCVELPFNMYYNYCFTGDGFLYIEGTSLKYFNLKDAKKSYTVQLASTDVSLAGSGGMHVVYTSSYIQIIGSQFPIEFAGEILGVECCDSYVAVHKREGGADSIRVFSGTGEQLDDIKFNNCYLTDFGFAKRQKATCLYSVSLSITSSTPISTVTTYSINPGATTGIITVQNQLLGQIYFAPKSTFAVGTSNIIRYTATGNYESYRLLTYGLNCRDFSSNDKTAMFIMQKNGGSDEDSLRVYSCAHDKTSNDSTSILLPQSDSKLIFTAKGELFSLTSDKLLKYSENGIVRKEYKLKFTIDSAQKLSDTQILLCSGGNLYVQIIKP